MDLGDRDIGMSRDSTGLLCMHASGSPGSCRAGTRPPAGAARAPVFFGQHILQHRLIQSPIGYQRLQPNVLFLELFELANLVNLWPDDCFFHR